MDTLEKIKVFETFEELTREIEADSTTHDMLAQRYTTRFIMLNNFNEFKRLAKFMVDKGVAMLDLETLIDEGEDDVWITKDMLKTAIKECKKSTFVTPFSEVARFFNDDDFRGFFNEVMLLEDIHNPNKRIYIPLIGLQNRFSDFLNHFARIRESAPVWRFDASAQSVEVFFTKYKNFRLPNGTVQCQLNSLKEWLMFWKKQAPQERIVCSSLPIAAKYKYSKPDNIFNFHQIANAYDFMTQFLDLRFPFGYEEGESKFWEELLSNLEKSKLNNFSFEDFVRTLFNKVKFTAADVIKVWGEKSNTAFHRWLLRKYVQYTSFSEDYPYIKLCLDSISNFTDEYQLAYMIATRILYNDSPANQKSLFAAERKTIISENQSYFESTITETDQNWMYDSIRELYQQQCDLVFAVELCTGVFDFEKKLLIGWSVLNPENAKLSAAIADCYPDYAAYISTNIPSHIKAENMWFVDYIKAYKQAKVEDKYSGEIVDFIRTKNKSADSFYQWYFGFENTHALLSQLKSDEVTTPDYVFWIDGLGSEFMSYILHLIELDNSDMEVVRSEFTRSYLPSSTHHNRFEDCKKFGTLDELGHDSHGYKHLDTLIEEIKVVKNIVQEILAVGRRGKCTIAIVSDHGLSCLSRKVPSKKYDGKFEHEGRYIKTTSDASSDSDYLVCENEEEKQNYKVALTHSSLSKVPTHQVHGGCTPEEVIVPFLLLSNKGEMGVSKYQVKQIGEDIMLSNPVVKITVIPQPSSVVLTYEGKSYDMKRGGTDWSVCLQNATEGKHLIDIKPAGSNSTQIEITIIGIGGNTDVNDLFNL